MSDLTWREGTGDEAGYWFGMQGDRHVATIARILHAWAPGRVRYQATRRYVADDGDELWQEVDSFLVFDEACAEVERYIVGEDDPPVER